MEIMTLPVKVFKNKMFDGCANGGISERYDTLYIACDDGYVKKNVEDEDVIELGSIICGNNTHFFAKPVGRSGGMAGGTFVYTSDSRFPFDYPLALHDRFEW